MKAMNQISQFVDSLRVQMTDRGWLLSVITAFCVVMGLICTSAGAVVGYLALTVGKVPVQQPAAMLSAGLLLLVATHSMWNYERWGRNVAVAVTFCMAWVMTEALCRRFGLGVEARTPVVAFAALALSYFTSAQARFLFRKKPKDDAENAESPKGEVA